MDDEICTRCLIVLNIEVGITAIWPDPGRREEAPHPTHPATLKAWLQNRLYLDDCRFETGNMQNTVRAISTWFGDPICSPHLYERVRAEFRGV